ncbi:MULTISPECIES: hypothetical protein [Streptomyces]|uniref:Lipoprotein n=2 Tax=Streptomyces TaxID=1883 RepID=A0ABU4KFG1_9ACTN|nr:hypothetical protein [Streptomyces roseolus]MDX2296535.1 hypothetical protein [Streptomyces roseolus]
MNVRRTALPLLTALLVGGCVALPQPSAPPAPQPPRTDPPALAPAAQRPASALPARPERPVEPEPREELAEAEGDPREAASVPVRATGTVPARRPQRDGGASARYGRGSAAPPAAAPAPASLPESRTPPPRPAATKPRPPRTRTATPRGIPAPAPRPAGAQAPEMRNLCREAQRIDAPMGAAELCRGLYGR